MRSKLIETKQSVVEMTIFRKNIRVWSFDEQSESNFLSVCKDLCEVLKVQSFNGPVAQLVRAPPCHGGGHGFESRLGRFIWDLSSAGRASALQAEGHRFEPYRSHFYAINIAYARVAELADAQDLKSCCGDTVPVRFRSRALTERSK